MGPTTDMEDCTDSSYFRGLPNEMVLKIMAGMKLKERFLFMEAYPTFLGFGQSSGLSIRVITPSESQMSMQELERVLDGNGKAIEILGECVDDFPSEQLILYILRVMPFLQEVTFTKCKVLPKRCRCPSMKQWNQIFDVFKAASVKSLTFDGCFYHDNPESRMNLTEDCWQSILENHVFYSKPDQAFRSIKIKNTFTLDSSLTVMESICVQDKRSFPDDDDNRGRMGRIKLENLEGEIFELGGKTGQLVGLWFLEQVLPLPGRYDNCHHLHAGLATSGRPFIKLTRAFDFEKIRRDMAMFNKMFPAQLEIIKEQKNK